MPDADLIRFVDTLALRISSFDRQALTDTKHLVNIASLPDDAEIAPEWDAFLASVQRPSSQTRIKKLMERGFHKAGDVENRLGYYVGQLGASGAFEEMLQLCGARILGLGEALAKAQV